MVGLIPNPRAMTFPAHQITVTAEEAKFIATALRHYGRDLEAQHDNPGEMRDDPELFRQFRKAYQLARYVEGKVK